MDSEWKERIIQYNQIHYYETEQDRIERLNATIDQLRRKLDEAFKPEELSDEDHAYLRLKYR